MYIKDYPNTILDKLYYGYMRFIKCKKVSIFDLFKVYRFKYADFLGGNTMFYEKGEKESFIKEILIKAGIVYISIRINNRTEKYNLLDNYNPKNVTDRIENPSIRYFPDPFQSTLEKVVLLILCDKGINISKFKKYSIYDDVLAFIINPNKFEYEKIALDNNNWINVMRIEKYLKIVIEKAKDIISKKLSYAISNGFANEEQNRLYYKYFEDTETRRF